MLKNEIKDGYLEFFEYFQIDENSFLKFAQDSIILSPKEKAAKEWRDLVQKIKTKGQQAYVRSYARNGSGNALYQNLYQNIFLCDVKVDPSNNHYPTKLLQDLTEYYKNSGKKTNLVNYQVSHIFGHTKNPYAFCAPWNIAFVPKILDPFTGHESKGELTKKITTLYKNLMLTNYQELIEEYNAIMDSIKSDIEIFIGQTKVKDKKILSFHQSLKNEFSKITW